MDRTLTEQERAWLRRGSEVLSKGEAWDGGNWVDTETGEVKPKDEPIDPQFWLDQIDRLRLAVNSQKGS